MLPVGVESHLNDLMKSVKKVEETATPSKPQSQVDTGSITLYLHGTGFSVSLVNQNSKQYLILQPGTSDKKIRLVPNDFKLDVQPLKFTITSIKGTKQSLGSIASIIEKAAPYNPNTKTGLSRREAPVTPKSKNTSKTGGGKK